MATTMQNVYFHMYTDVYLSQTSLAYERHIQKAVELGNKESHNKLTELIKN